MEKTKILPAIMFIAFAMILGCGNSEPESKSVATSAQDVKQKTQEAIQAVKNYSEEQMKEYRDALRNKMNSLEQSHQELQAKLEDMKEGAKKDMEQVIKNLEEKKADLEHKSQELQTATGEAFGDLKVGTEKALAELEEAYEQAIQRFSS